MLHPNRITSEAAIALMDLHNTFPTTSLKKTLALYKHPHPSTTLHHNFAETMHDLSQRKFPHTTSHSLISTNKLRSWPIKICKHRTDCGCCCYIVLIICHTIGSLTFSLSFAQWLNQTRSSFSNDVSRHRKFDTLIQLYFERAIV